MDDDNDLSKQSDDSLLEGFWRYLMRAVKSRYVNKRHRHDVNTIVVFTKSLYDLCASLFLSFFHRHHDLLKLIRATYEAYLAT